MDDSHLRCSLCDQKYSDESIPRNLGCGHCLCTSCADEVIKNDKRCPECQAEILHTLDQLTVNFPLLRVARALGSSKSMPCQDQLERNFSESGGGQDPPFDSEKTLCKIHKSILDHRCMQCREWVCPHCISAFHSPPHRSQCRILPLEEAMKEMKKSICHDVESKIASIKHNSTKC